MGRLTYRREIDGLRAIAVLAVVLYHASAGLVPGGFVGVDVFFVISGYLITALLMTEWREKGRIDLPAFYARRIRRLMPAMCLVVAVTVAVSLLLLPPLGAQLQRLTDSATASLLYVANFYFQANSGGYFDGPAEEMPLLHLWSLAVEEQYYLIYPALVLLVLRTGPRRLPHVLFGLGLASFLLAEHWLQVSPQVAFYQMPARFWELAFGALVAQLPPSRRIPLAPAWTAMAGLVLMACSFAGAQVSGHFPGLGALPAVLGAALVLHAVHIASNLGVAGAVLTSRPMVFLGLISYSLYLWHWPLLAIDRTANLEASSLIVRLALCVLAAVLAWLTYHHVEMRWRRRPATNQRVFVIGAMATCAMLAFTMGLGLIVPSDEETDRLVIRTRDDRPVNMTQCHYGLGARIEALKSESCQSTPGKPARIVLWGDSHALAWQPFAFELGYARKDSVASHTLDACPPITGFTAYRSDVPRHRESCIRLNELVMELIATGRVDTVVIAARWPSYFESGLVSRSEVERKARTDDIPQGKLATAQALRRTVRAIARNARQVILLGPTPVLHFAAPLCIGSGRLDQCALSREVFDVKTSETRRLLMMASAGLTNVAVVDPTGFFCNELDCPVLKNGYALYWDDDHVSSTAARTFAKEYLRQMEGSTVLPEAAPQPLIGQVGHADLTL